MKLTCKLWGIIASVFMAGPKPMPTEFGIHHRFESFAWLLPCFCGSKLRLGGIFVVFPRRMGLALALAFPFLLRAGLAGAGLVTNSIFFCLLFVKNH